jgi:hypothetical protein
VIFELIEDTTKLGLIVACLYFALGAYVHRKRPAWSDPLENRRLVIVLVLVLAVSAIKVSEDGSAENQDRSTRRSCCSFVVTFPAL